MKELVVTSKLVRGVKLPPPVRAALFSKDHPDTGAELLVMVLAAEVEGNTVFCGFAGGEYDPDRRDCFFTPVGGAVFATLQAIPSPHRVVVVPMTNHKPADVRTVRKVVQVAPDRGRFLFVGDMSHALDGLSLTLNPEPGFYDVSP